MLTFYLVLILINIIIFWTVLNKWAVLEHPSSEADIQNTYIILALWDSIGEDWRNIFLLMLMILFPFGSLLSLISYNVYKKHRVKKDMLRSLSL